MNDGVALLLERMKTHPEEFVDGGKWAHIMNKHEDFLDAEDRQALTDGLNKLMQQRFTEKILEELVEPKKIKLRAIEYPTTSGKVTLNSGAVTGTITMPTPIAGVTQTL